MPVDHRRARPASLIDLSRRIIVTTEPEALIALDEELPELLKGIAYEKSAPIPALGLLSVEIAELEHVGIALQRFRDRKVLAAEPNVPVHLSGVVMPAVDDPLYWDQWAPPRIGAEAAWRRAKDAITAARTPTVAIVDTGISTSHPDLAAHLWDNGAGSHGFNVLTGTDFVEDMDGHGTLLAGTIGAVGNNTTGIAAADWPIALMPVVFHTIRAPVDAWSGILAIAWAVIVGKARVVTLAWDVGLPLFALRQALRVLGLAPWRALFVAAAGNDGLDNDVLPTFPASYGGMTAPNDLPNVISAMASDEEDDKPGFSNYGTTSVHIGAPGIRILSTHYYLNEARWRFYSGTSAACAHVAHAAAILNGLNPGWTPEQIRQHLIDSADVRPLLRCQQHARLNLERAVCGPMRITAPAAGAVLPAGSSLTVTWERDYATALCTSLRVMVGSQAAGTFTVLATSRPNSGSTSVTLPNVAIADARIRLKSEQAPASVPGLYADSPIFTIAV